MNQSGNRQIKVFVSSTFKDMQDERNHLAVKVFPVERRKALKKGVNLSWIDLRWGITDEEAVDGQVLFRCIDSVKKCQPYFIGIIGDYYGTTLTRSDIEKSNLVQEDKDLIFSHLKENGDSISITEIEILFGAFHKYNTNAIFFIKEELKAEDSKILRLIERIDKRGFKYYKYGSKWQLGKLISQELSKFIPDLGKVPTFETEKIVQEAILKSYWEDIHEEKNYKELNDKLQYRIGYIGIPEVPDAYCMSRHVHAIIGDWGIGKSSYISNWIKKIQKRGDCIVLYYFINSISAYDTAWQIASYFVNNLLERDEYKCLESKLNAIDNPFKKLNILVEKTHILTNKVLVIILDGLDNIRDNSDSSYDAKVLDWIHPNNVNVLLVVSTNSSDYSAKRYLEGKSDKEEWYTSLNADSYIPNDFIREYLKRYDKKIQDRLNQQLITSKQIQNPLLLRIFLDLLISCTTHENLTQLIQEINSAPNFDELFSIYLLTLEKYFPHENLEILKYMYVSKNGLTAIELAHLTHIKYSEIIAFLILLDGFVYSKDYEKTNELAFIKNIDVKKFVSIFAEIDGNTIRINTAKFLSSQFPILTKIYETSALHLYAEILHQLFKLNDSIDLAHYIINPDLILNLTDRSSFSNYWKLLYDNYPISMSAYFDPKILEQVKDGEKLIYLNKLLGLVCTTGNIKESSIIVNEVLKELEKSNYLERNDNKCFTNLSLHVLGLLFQAIEICIKIKDYQTIRNFVARGYFESIRMTIAKSQDKHKYNYEYYLNEIIHCESILLFDNDKNGAIVFDWLQENEENILVKCSSKRQREFINLRIHCCMLKAMLITTDPMISILKNGQFMDVFSSFCRESLVMFSKLNPDCKIYVARFYLLYSQLERPYENLNNAKQILDEITDTGLYNTNMEYYELYKLELKLCPDKIDIGKTQKNMDARKYNDKHEIRWDFSENLSL